VLSVRQTLFSTFCRNETVQRYLHVTPRDVRRLELRALSNMSSQARDYNAYEQNLATATYLQDLIPKCEELGINIQAFTSFEVAKVLWDQGELQSSIRILQRLSDSEDIDKQEFSPGRGMILASLV
jgi:serine-protein kinase ATM